MDSLKFLSQEQQMDDYESISITWTPLTPEFKLTKGLEIRGCQEPRAPLNHPAAPSNFCREPKEFTGFYTQHLLKMQMGSLEKDKLNFEPWASHMTYVPVCSRGWRGSCTRAPWPACSRRSARCGTASYSAAGRPHLRTYSKSRPHATNTNKEK